MSTALSCPVITVIVPVYNTEKYLDDMIQSVLNQSFADWELLLIDDGSSDNSGRICDRYAETEERVRAFHTENGGYNRARNLGLRHAKGDWVMFLDSDDCLAPYALEHMLQLTDHADLVMGLYQTVPRHTMPEENIPGGRFETLADLGDLLPEVYEPYFFLSVCTKLYRRHVLENTLFQETGPLMSDLLYNFKILPLCKGICLLPEVVYYYRSGDHVSTCSYFRSEWLYVSKQVYEAVTGYFPEHPKVEAFMSRRYANRVGQHLTIIAILPMLNKIQKLAMIEAEREDPFYKKPAILQAECGKNNAAIWKAFLNRDSKEVLKAAEQKITEIEKNDFSPEKG